MGAPDCERLIDAPEGREKLKLRGRPTLRGLAATNRTLPGNRRADRIHQCVSVLPKCPPSGDAQNAAITDGRSFFSHRPKSWVRATIAGLSSGRAVAPGCMAGYLWPSTARRPLDAQEFSPAGFPRKRGPTGIPRACACGAKIRGLRPGRSAALARRSPLAGSGSVSSSRP